MGLRVAAVDIGTNAIRFVAVEMTSKHQYIQLDADRIPVRLGRGVSDSGHLNPTVMRVAVEALGRVGDRIRELGIRHYRAVATAAVRDSPSGRRFVEAVRRKAGLQLETISAHEEIRLVHLAVRHRIDGVQDGYMLVDVGGGSVDAALIRDRRLVWTESHPVGAVRLLEEYGSDEPSPARLRRLIEEGLERFRLVNPLPKGSGLAIVGTGGNIDELAELADLKGDDHGLRVLTIPQLEALVKMLARRTPDQRARDFGLGADRADVILPAALVFMRLAKLCGATEILVPQVGLKDGLILDQAHGLIEQVEHEKDRDDILRAGLAVVGRRYRFDEPHCDHVASLALQLFDRLGRLHGLGKEDRRLLHAAGMLHDIGKYIDERKHHKHSSYLIQNTEIPGLSPSDQRLVAAIARYHRKGLPEPGQGIFKQLQRDERRRVNRLAVLLRIADALDREHLQRVKRLSVRGGAGRVRLRLSGDGDLLLEQWAADRESSYFQRIFRRRLDVEAGDHANGSRI